MWAWGVLNVERCLYSCFVIYLEYDIIVFRKNLLVEWRFALWIVVVGFGHGFECGWSHVTSY